MSEGVIVDQHGKQFANVSGGGHSFTAGNRHSRELGKWQPHLRSADYDILPEKAAIEGRAHDLARNNGFANGAVQSQKDTVVGHQYRLNLMPEYKLLGISAEDANDWASEVEACFHLWAEDPECWVDASRKRTFTQIIREGVGSEILSGEYMLSREWRSSPTGFNTCFQVIEPERIRTPYSRHDDDRMRAGVELDRYGAPVAYHVLNRHPNDHFYSNDQYSFKRVTKYNRFNWLQFIHTFEATRGGQTRGYSQLSSIIKKMKMLDRQEDVELEASILAATYACLLYTSPSPRDLSTSRMPSSA